MDPWHQSPPPAVSTTLGATNSFVAEAKATHPQTIPDDSTVPIAADVDAGAHLAMSDEAGLDNAYNTAYEAEDEGSSSSSDSDSDPVGKLPYDIEKCLEIADACSAKVTSATCANPDVANILEEIIADAEKFMTIRDAAIVTLESVHRYPVRIRNEEDFLELLGSDLGVAPTLMAMLNNARKAAH